MPAARKGLALLGVFIALGASWASDWPRWRGPEGNGISSETEWKPQSLARPKIKWRLNVGAGHSSISIVGKRVYTMGNQGGQDIVSCLDVETGKLVWHFAYACPPGNFAGPRATPAFEGGLLYTLSRKGDALCLDAESGKVRWSKDLVKEYRAQTLDYGIAGSPLVVGDAVLYNVLEGGVALNRTTGEKLWASAPGPGGYATPVAIKHKGKDAAAIFGAHAIAIVDVAKGEKLDSFAWQTQFDANAADPMFFDGKLFITSGWDHGCALLDLSGKSIRSMWENKNLRGQLASPILWDGCIYGIDDNTPNGQLRCLDAVTGAVKWTQKGGYECLSMAGGKLLSIDKKGNLIVVEAAPTGYKEIVRTPLLSAQAKNWTAPVLANGFLYCRNGEGELVCLDVR
jgi:outer membrane protein assembly factor BamB